MTGNEENKTRTDKQLSGEIPDMHELLATASPAQRAMAEMERLLSSGTSEDTPPKSAESHLSHDTKLYTDNIGRNHFIDEIQVQGSFYVKPEVKTVIAFSVLLMIPSGVVLIFLVTLLNPLLRNAPLSVINIFLVVESILFVIGELCVCFQCIIKTRGPLHQYKADGRAFYVTVNGKGKDQILFKDVLKVDYTLTKFLWGERGYKVDIFTTYGVVRYNYIFPRFNQRILPGNLPFDVLIRNIPKRDETDQATK